MTRTRDRRRPFGLCQFGRPLRVTGRLPTGLLSSSEFRLTRLQVERRSGLVGQVGPAGPAQAAGVGKRDRRPSGLFQLDQDLALLPGNQAVPGPSLCATAAAQVQSDLSESDHLESERSGGLSEFSKAFPSPGVGKAFPSFQWPFRVRPSRRPWRRAVISIFPNFPTSALKRKRYSGFRVPPDDSDVFPAPCRPKGSVRAFSSSPRAKKRRSCAGSSQDGPLWAAPPCCSAPRRRTGSAQRLARVSDTARRKMVCRARAALLVCRCVETVCQWLVVLRRPAAPPAGTSHSAC